MNDDHDVYDYHCCYDDHGDGDDVYHGDGHDDHGDDAYHGDGHDDHGDDVCDVCDVHLHDWVDNYYLDNNY
jgi:hypothetical protein